MAFNSFSTVFNGFSAVFILIGKCIDIYLCSFYTILALDGYFIGCLSYSSNYFFTNYQFWKKSTFSDTEANRSWLI